MKQIVTLLSSLFIVCSFAQFNAADANSAKKLDLNRASVSELATLPGIGKSKAKAIVEHRSKSPFQEVEELLQVKGIGKKLFGKIQNLVMVTPRSTSKYMGVKRSSP